MTVVAHVYDDDEDVPTPTDDLSPDHVVAIGLIRAVPDRRIRRALMAIFVLAVLDGRVGR